ncbi:hypothetical protein R3P38DRAFT_3245025 [Favolaschia claudopus]|uniref:SnoaL-like domain-containing protein n=1 Tax=Favolaschia claudopus TaxID=2862362 RepID=A0AAV9Z1F2_9AGAR
MTECRYKIPTAPPGVPQTTQVELIASIQTKQLETANAFLSRYNVEGLAELFAPSFTYELFPASLPAPEGKFKRNKEETLGLFKHAWEEMFETMVYLPPMEGEDAVVWHLKSDGTMKNGKKYNNEYMITLRFSGERIVYMKEFVDTKYVVDLFAA